MIERHEQKKYLRFAINLGNPVLTILSPDGSPGGITVELAKKHPGQERYDTFSGRVVSRFKGSMEEWQAMGVMNYEMESATLLTMCASQGLRAGMVAGVIVNRTQQEIPNAETMKQTESHAVKIVVEAARRLL